MSISELQAARAALEGHEDAVGGQSIAERAQAAPSLHAAVDPQDGLFDVVIENDALSRALEKRQELKEQFGPLKKEYEAATDAVKALLGDMALDEEIIVRTGRFRIKRTVQEGTTVSFERAPGTRVSISVVGGED